MLGAAKVDPGPFQESFRDGPKDQTSDVQSHIGESRSYENLQANFEIPGSRLRRAPE
jgi:hypothetical protein